MPPFPLDFTRTERAMLIALAVVGFVFVNGAFLYGVSVMPGSLVAALLNPVSAAFMFEALLLMLLAAWLVAKWKPSRLGAVAFVALSLLGGLAFSIPVLLLMPRRDRGSVGTT